MKIKKIIQIIGIVAALFSPVIGGVHAQVSNNPWKIISNQLVPSLSTWSMQLPYLGGNGVVCLQTDNSGNVSDALSACGSGGGGGSASAALPLGGVQYSTQSGTSTILAASSSFTYSSSTGNVTLASLTISKLTNSFLTVNGSGQVVATTTPGFGTVTSVTCGTGLSGGTITTTGTCANTGVLSIGGLTGAVSIASLNLQNPITLTTTGTSGASSFNSTTGALNIPNYANTTYTNGSGLSLTGTTFALIAPVTPALGGTGTTTVPTAGQVLVGLANGTYAPESTSSLGFISGNQTITLSGDATGSGTTTIPVTLATVNTNVGTYGSASAVPSVTVNGKGLVTAISTTTVVAPAGTLTGTTLNSTVVTSSLTSVGTLASLIVSGQSSLGNASTTGLTVTSTSTLSGVKLTNLTNSILAVDSSGNVISTTTSAGGVTAVNASAPLNSSGGSTPSISLTGIVGFANGGTGTSSCPANDVFLSNGTIANCVATSSLGISGGGAVSSVSNSDGTLTISPTTGSVVASLALGHANTWTGGQIFGNSSSTNFFSTSTVHINATSTNLFATSSVTVNSTSTNLFATTASTSNIFGAGLANCSTSMTLSWSGGTFLCSSLQPSGMTGSIHNGQVLVTTSSVAGWGAVDLSNSTFAVANQLGVGNGGTGSSSYAVGSILTGSSTNPIFATLIGASSTCLESNGTIPIWGTCASGGGTNYFSNSSATTSLTTGTILNAPTGTFGIVNATSTTGTSTISGALKSNIYLYPDGSVMSKGLGSSLYYPDSTVLADSSDNLYLNGGGVLFDSTGSAGSHGNVLMVSTSTGAAVWVATSSLGISGGGTNYFTNSSATTSLSTGSILTATTGTFGNINATTTTATSTFSGNLAVSGNTTLGNIVNPVIITAGTSTTVNAANVNIGTSTMTGTFNIQGSSTLSEFVVASSSGSTTETIDSAGHILFGGPKPTCDANCTILNGTDVNFRILTGTAKTTTTITFATPFKVYSPECDANDEGGTILASASSTLTTVTLTFLSALTSASVTVQCLGNT